MAGSDYPTKYSSGEHEGNTSIPPFSQDLKLSFYSNAPTRDKHSYAPVKLFSLMFISLSRLSFANTYGMSPTEPTRNAMQGAGGATLNYQAD